MLFEDGDAANLSDAAAVADAYLLGTEALASFTFADDKQGVRRLATSAPSVTSRVTITPANNAAGNIFIAGVWLLGHPNSAPTANPPA